MLDFICSNNYYDSVEENPVLLPHDRHRHRLLIEWERLLCLRSLSQSIDRQMNRYTADRNKYVIVEQLVICNVYSVNVFDSFDCIKWFIYCAAMANEIRMARYWPVSIRVRAMKSIRNDMSLHKAHNRYNSILAAYLWPQLLQLFADH